VSHKPESGKPQSKEPGGKLIQSAIGSFGFRIAQLGLSFLVSVLLTRTLGVEGYGIYAYAMSWVLILNIIGSLGSRGLVVREIATNRSQEKWGVIRGLCSGQTA